MSDTLLNQFDRLYKEEIALRDARIMALQSQINPHFLNNTLEIINWEARLAGNDRVSSMIESLSVMMDAAADRSHTPMIPLEEEFKYVNAYLHIIQKRLGKRLTVIKEIDESLYSYKVPRLILQPILENAIEHGVDKCDKGTVIIRAYKNDDDNGLFFLEVENDGLFTRRDEDRIKTILAPNYEPPKGKKGSLGIRNVNQRLKIIYGEKGGLYITMTSKGGALAKIVMTIEQTKQ